MELKNQRILITGATGLIGSNLAERLLQDGNVLYVTGRNKKKLDLTFEEYLNSGQLYTIEHDASEPIPAVIKDIDFIFHAAGPMERDVVMNKPVSVIMPNILGTIHCLEFLKNQAEVTGKKGRMIVFSSVTVYANPTNEDYTAIESDTTHAIFLEQLYACYAESKRMAEVIAQSYRRQYGIDIVIARFSTVYGYCKNIPNTAFFEFIKKAISGEDIVLNGSGMPRRDNIYVDDAVEGLIVMAERGLSGEAYNISSNGDLGNFASVDEIALIITQEVSKLTGGREVKIITPSMYSERNPGLKLSNYKLKELGFEIRYSHFSGVRETLIKLTKHYDYC